jgi:hypothetical protein
VLDSSVKRAQAYIQEIFLTEHSNSKDFLSIDSEDLLSVFSQSEDKVAFKACKSDNSYEAQYFF